MPAAQLFSDLLERGLNTLLKLDPDSKISLQKLKGKRLLVSINELSVDLVIVASQQIDVLILERARLDGRQTKNRQTNARASGQTDPVTLEGADCYLKTSLFTLPELQDSSRLTHLIKQDKLQIEGDIQLAQAFSQLFLKLNIDWEEQLAKRTNDVLAYEVFRFGKNLFSKADKFRQSMQTMLSEAAIEEKHIAAPTILVEDFICDVFDLKSQSEQFEQRLQRFENKHKGNL